MSHFKLLAAAALASAALVGCDSGDTYKINYNYGDSGSTNTGGSTAGSACADAGLASEDFIICSGDTALLQGTINKNYTLTNIDGVTWGLSGVVKVGNGNVEIADDAEMQAIKDAGVTLTIPAGTHIRARAVSSLIVTRGSKINAVGTAAEPITFSSAKDDDFDGKGEWGGVIIQGFSPQITAAGPCQGEGVNAKNFCNVLGEGGDSIKFYGGVDVDDNSGTIKYVRIAEGGISETADNEINGLTLMGVGHGTTIEHVQVHNNLDDGIEWFGGTVDVKYALLTNNDDDDIDFDEGYNGNIQYALIIKEQTATAPQGSNDPRGIEANSSDQSAVSETSATLANITLIGGPAQAVKGEPGMRLRGSVSVKIVNSVVVAVPTKADGSKGHCVRIDDSDTNGDGTINEFSDVTLKNVIGNCGGAFYQVKAPRVGADTEQGEVGDRDPLSLDTAMAIAQAATATVAGDDIQEELSGSSFAFDNTTFIGAVEPGVARENTWWAEFALEGSVPAAIN